MRRKRFRFVKFMILIVAVFTVLRGVNYVKNDLFHLQGSKSYLQNFNDEPNQDDAIDVKQTTGKRSGDIYSEHAILLDLKSGEVLYSKASGEKTYPASLTKIMTAILSIENIPDLQKTVSLSETEYNHLVKENASMAGFLPNEKVRAIDLLYGTMLPSGADAATALADGVSGSQSRFVDLMNKKAKELGMNHTHFTNVTGLHNSDHYTTVKDMSILLRYSLKNQIFREIFTSKRHSTTPTNRNPSGITCVSTLFQKIESPEFNGGKILGGKTGYTDEAGLCLASLAEKRNTEYILVTTNASGNHNTEQFDITDAKKIYSNI